jgi:hypothetical protein
MASIPNQRRRKQASTPLDRWLGTLRKNRKLAERVIALLEENQPCSLRALLYLCVSSGVVPSTDKKYYRQLCRLTGIMREAGVVPRTWIVDTLRQTFKPNSWSGLADFGDVVQRAYRKDFWAKQPDYPCIAIEKDARAAIIQPVTHELDVALHVCRGYASVSFAGAIADEWKIDKPVYVYYLGDYDASGFDIERDLREKLSRYSNREVCAVGEDHQPPYLRMHWRRLGVVASDFDAYDLIRLAVKHSDSRARKFVAKHGVDQGCAELDALPPNELRARVREAIEAHIDQDEWQRVKAVEAAERESLKSFTANFGRASA